jgi:hypothetical protein
MEKFSFALHSHFQAGKPGHLLMVTTGPQTTMEMSKFFFKLSLGHSIPLAKPSHIVRSESRQRNWLHLYGKLQSHTVEGINIGRAKELEDNAFQRTGSRTGNSQ